MMTRQDRHDRLNSILGSYLGISDYIRICAANDLKINLDYITKRLIQLRTEHDHVETAYFER
jgi:hypothetical protein